MPRKSRKNVGLIGLGIIGSRVAASLRASGYHVFVWNRTAKPTPNFLGSPAEVAEICEVIQLFVADSQAVFEMIEALGDALTPRHVVVCSATIGPEATLEAARLVAEKGAQFLDAPFTGSRAAAERSQLVYYVGGDEAVFLRAKPVLEASGKAIVRCGKVGDAATLKVVTNLISAVTTQVLAEALAVTRCAGIQPEVLTAALEQNACRSGTIELKLPKMARGDYDPHFSLKHMFKDVQLGIHLANSLDLEVPATTVTAGVMYGALNNGWADLDFASIYKIYDGVFAKLDQLEALPPIPAAPADEADSSSATKAGIDSIEPRSDAEQGRTAAAPVASGDSSPVESSSEPSGSSRGSDTSDREESGGEAESRPETAVAKGGTDPGDEPENGASRSEHGQGGEQIEGAAKAEGGPVNATVAGERESQPGNVSAPATPDAEKPAQELPENGATGPEPAAFKPFNRIIRRFFTPASK